MRRIHRSITLGWIGALCIAAMLVVSCEEPQEVPEMSRNYKGEVTDGAIPVETLVLRPCTVDDTHLAQGVIEAQEEVTLSAEIAGRILKMPHEIGDQVAKGDVLVSLDDSSLRAQQKRIEAQISRTETLQEQARKNLEREQKLFEAKAGAERTMDDARTQVRMHENEIVAQKAELEAIQVDLRKFTVRSPVEGAIAEKHSSEGEYASPGFPLYKVVTNNEVEFVFSTPEADVSKIKVGDPVDIEVDVMGDNVFTGKIKAIAPAGNLETRTFRVWAVIENPEPHPLLPGMSGKARVKQGRYENVFVVPEEALLRDGETAWLMIVEADKVRRVDVREVAGMGSKAVLDATGLPAETTCILYGQHAVKDGDTVRVRKTHESIPEKSFN